MRADLAPQSSGTVQAQSPSREHDLCATSASLPNGVGECQTKPMRDVGEVRHIHSAGPRLTDEQREAAIERAIRAMEHHMAEVAAINARVPHVFSDFVDAAASRWMADRAKESMQKLIAGRSPEQIARMERALGLDMPACANEARRA